MSEEEIEHTESVKASAEVVTPSLGLSVSVDKINSLVQKEDNLKRAGVTRYKYMLVIAEALEAVKVGDIVHANGNVTRGEVPDVARRQWAAEQAARLYGDMIERKEIEHDIGDKTLERFKSLSVRELKERAQAILKDPSLNPRLPIRGDND